MSPLIKGGVYMLNFVEYMNKDFYKLFEIMQRQDNEVLGAEEIELME